MSNNASPDLCVDWYVAQIQELNQRLHDQSVRLNEIEERTELIVHDLKNPLLGANRILEFLMAEGAGMLSEQQKALISSLRSNNTELLSLLANLSESVRKGGRLSELTYERIDMQELFIDYMSRLAPFLELRKVRVDFKLFDAISISADRLLISRLIYNLLDNATRYSPDDATISVELHAKNGHCCFQISDEGPGVASNELESIFEKYWHGAAHDRSSRNGLGLYICRQIVQAHGGNIWCTSGSGEGCKFDVVLPGG